MKDNESDAKQNMFSSEEAGAYLEKAIPLSIVIASLKTALLRPVTDEIISKLEKNRNTKLTKADKEAFEKIIRDIISNLPSSVCGFDDPDWVPKSEQEVRQRLTANMTEEKHKVLINIIINKIKNSQTRMAEFFD